MNRMIYEPDYSRMGIRLQMLIPMCTVICIAGAILLLLHAEGSRSKRLLAYVMLAWGIAYAIRIFGLLFGFMGTLESSVLALCPDNR